MGEIATDARDTLPNGMLRRFLYLDVDALVGYLSAVEGGIASEKTSRQTRRSGRRARANLGYGPAGAGVAREREQVSEEAFTVAETAEQRFDRLMRLLSADPAAYAFQEEVDLLGEFETLRTGMMVSIDCELEIPDTVRVLAQPERMTEFVDALDALRPLAGLLGREVEELPSSEQTRALHDFVRAARTDLVVVGQQAEEGSPRLAGKLASEFLREDPEGEATVVGKVARVWEEGDSHPLLALPGASLLSRSRRRNVSSELSEDSVLRGPAVTLDVLAIYR